MSKFDKCVNYILKSNNNNKNNTHTHIPHAHTSHETSMLFSCFYSYCYRKGECNDSRYCSCASLIICAYRFTASPLCRMRHCCMLCSVFSCCSLLVLSNLVNLFLCSPRSCPYIWFRLNNIEENHV